MARTLDMKGRCIDIGDILSIPSSVADHKPFLVEVVYMPMSGIIASFVYVGPMKGTFMLTASPLVSLWQRKAEKEGGASPYTQTV